MLVLASLVLGFVMLDALCGLDLVWLHPGPMRPYLVVTTWMRLRMLGCFVHTLSFSTSCDDMLVMLVRATYWLSIHLYMLTYMFMHESCLLAYVSSILQHNEDMDTRSKLIFVPH